MYERAMNRFSKELLEAIAKRYNEGKPELIKDDLRRISRKFGIAFADADMERKRIEKQLADEWTRDRSNDKIPKIVNTGKNTPLNPRRGLKEEESSPLLPLRRGTIIENADGAFARMRNSVNRDVKRAVDRAIKAKMPTAEAVKIIKRVLGKLRADAATIGRTAKMGKIRSDFIRKALADGIRKFRYVGPSGASGTMDGPRTFCQRNLGKVFTIEEILELNNGQGLPVLIYMGGYNCRHWWEAVSENYELRITNDEKSGKVEIAEEWAAALEKARTSPGKINNKPENSYDTMIKEKEVAEEMARYKINEKYPYQVQLDNTKLNFKGGPTDIVLNGINTEVKHPKEKLAKKILGMIKGQKGGYATRQSDSYVFRLQKPLSELEYDKFKMQAKELQDIYLNLKFYLIYTDLNNKIIIEEF